MKALRYITTSLAALILTFTGTAQSRAYAKFDANGEIIGLFNLANGRESCRESQTLEGTTRNVKFEIRNIDIVFTFMLVSSDGRRTIGFSLRSDAIPRSDIEALLSEKRPLHVNVEACKNGGRLVVREITRAVKPI